MGIFSEAEAAMEKASERRPGEEPFTVIDNPLFTEACVETSDLCLYIEDMTRALRGAAMSANQELLAFLLGAAAAEARLQAGKMYMDQMRG